LALSGIKGAAAHIRQKAAKADPNTSLNRTSSKSKHHQWCFEATRSHELLGIKQLQIQDFRRHWAESINTTVT
jgi:hypothetical protein